MTREEMTELLDDNGYEISDEQRLPDSAGWRFRLASGQIINLFDGGSWQVEGSNRELIESLLSEYQTGN